MPSRPRPSASPHRRSTRGSVPPSAPPVAAKVGLGSGRTYERAKSLLEEVEQAPDANEPDLGSHGEVEFDKGDAEDLVFETRSNA